MLRIVHISDLHIRHPSVNNDTESVLQTGVRIVLQRHGITIEAGGHDDSKLTLLKASVASLKPHVIVVTGDLTNFGDQPSFKMAGEFLSALKAESGATQLFCVPGNHDCLFERAAALQQTGGKVKRLFLKVIGQGNRETQVMQQAAAQQYSLDGEKPSPTALLLENYMRLCDEKGFGHCHPAKPVQVDARWGWVSFFPFNSVNGPGLMANKGAIGDRQLATFSSYAQGEDWPAHARAVRIALLHHHPISAPQSRDTDINRGYDWMDATNPWWLDSSMSTGLEWRPR